MTITVRRSEASDRADILALMDASRGEGLTVAERGERGFVQGAMDERILANLQQGTGVFIAGECGALAGFAMSSEPSAVGRGPARLSIDAAHAAVGDRRFFLHGPVAVGSRFQGRGVLTLLLTEVSKALRERFDLGVAFVEAANTKSLVVHRHYQMTEVPGFSLEGRDYHVFTFDPAEFAARAAAGPTLTEHPQR